MHYKTHTISSLGGSGGLGNSSNGERLHGTILPCLWLQRVMLEIMPINILNNITSFFQKKVQKKDIYSSSAEDSFLKLETGLFFPNPLAFRKADIAVRKPFIPFMFFESLKGQKRNEERCCNRMAEEGKETGAARASQVLMLALGRLWMHK